MLLRLLFLQFASLILANPFHKFPYVFLLDVGNEEVQKISEDQIRVSIPGGSLAVRYPAVGDGQTIAHVRVSGIDFGTDLKANILDGGPGYKYVLLVFMGNPGVPYDAVITVQTMADEIDGDNSENGTEKILNNVNSYQVAESDQENQTNNDSKEDSSSLNPELSEERAALPNYDSNLKISNDYEENNSAENIDAEDIHIPKKVDYNQQAENLQQNLILNSKKYDQGEEKLEDDNQSVGPVAQKYTAEDDITNEVDQPIQIDKDLYEKYMILKPNLYNLPASNGADATYYLRPNYSDDTVEVEQMFDDKLDNDANKYRDDSQNNGDDDDDGDSVDY